MVNQTPASWENMKSEYHPPGTSPGTLRESKDQLPCTMKLIQYGSNFYSQNDVTDLKQLQQIKKEGSVRWIDLQGTPDRECLEALGSMLNLHPLSLEDVANGGQHSKVEDFGEYLFIVLYVLPRPEELEPVQVNIFLGTGYVLSICREGEEVFKLVRQQIEKAQGTVRQQPAGYLCYSLCDAIIDHFFPVLEGQGDRLSILEDQTFAGASAEIVQEIHQLKINLFLAGRLIMEAQEVIGEMQGGKIEHIDSSLTYYLRDALDHTQQMSRSVESYRQIADSILNSHLSLKNHQMNEVIKILTIIATIFIPLTFIVGVYGMNFRPEAGPYNMPEITWAYGYPIIWGVMLIIVGIMILLFRRKKWF